MGSDRIAAAVLAFVHERGAWTGVTPLYSHVRIALGRKRLSMALVDEVEGELDDLVAEGLLLSRKDGADLPEYIMRDRFFEGKRFLVRLTPLEREKGLLVVGHRFTPFVFTGVDLGDVEVLFEGKTLPRGHIRMTAAESMVYYTLLGRTGWIERLVEANGEDAVAVALQSEGTLGLPTVDLGPVLKRHPGASGFLIECTDYGEGVVQVVGVRDAAAPVDFHGVAAACRALDTALGAVFDEWEPETIPIAEQIALAYARMPESFFADPPFHFGGYLELTKAVTVAMGFMTTTLWRQGEDPKDAIDPEERADIEEMIGAFRTTLERAEADREARRSGQRSRRGSDGVGGAVQPDAADVSTALPSPGRAPRQTAGGAPGIYTLDVALEGQKRIRRRIEVHEDNFWQDLHEAIFDAFDRDDEHLYAFYLTFEACPSKPKRRRAPVIGPDLPSEGLSRDRDAARTRIGDDTLNAKDKLYYLFDFGDEWWHVITVVSVEGRPGAEAEEYPRLVDCRGDSPPQYPPVDEEE